MVFQCQIALPPSVGAFLGSLFAAFLVTFFLALLTFRSFFHPAFNAKTALRIALFWLLFFVLFFKWLFLLFMARNLKQPSDPGLYVLVFTCFEELFPFLTLFCLIWPQNVYIIWFFLARVKINKNMFASALVLLVFAGACKSPVYPRVLCLTSIKRYKKIA